MHDGCHQSMHAFLLALGPESSIALTKRGIAGIAEQRPRAERPANAPQPWTLPEQSLMTSTFFHGKSEMLLE